MNGIERMCAAIRRETPDRVPTFEWFIDASVGNALTGSNDPLDVVERLDIDGANIRPDYGKRFIDSQIFEDEWGSRRQLTGDSIPAVIAHPVADLTHHRDFRFPDPCADGNVLPLVDDWIEAGIDCLDPIDPGAGLAMAGMKAAYGRRIALKGNIDCVKTLCSGTPGEVRDEVCRCIRDGGPGGLIVSSSNTIHRGVKPANYLAMLEALREFGTFDSDPQPT